MTVEPRRVLVCLDKFRGSVTAAQACAALAGGIRQTAPNADVREIPMADGGEGTVDALLATGYTRHATTVTGPLGAPVAAAFAVRGSRAVIEMAQAAGLQLVAAAPQPMRASSIGVGELIDAAIAAGCTEVVLAVGGSACTDGGAGMLQALGARLLDATGAPISLGGGGLADLAMVDLDPVRTRVADVSFLLATDVTNPLTGPDGAAAVFAPQKGATRVQVDELEAALTRFADLLGGELRYAPGAGAGGGIGFGALVGFGARQVPGIDFVIDELGVADELSGAHLVVVGEGRLDEQSLHGKAPAGVAALARERAVPVAAVAGEIRLSAEQLELLGISVAHSILDRCGGDLEIALAESSRVLAEIGADLGRHLARVADRVRLTALVRGRVQGVGFRYWVRSQAEPLELSGAATNLPDGRVEIVAEGPRAACERLLAALRGGRTPGRVSAVAATWSQAQTQTQTQASGFRVR